MQEMKIALKEYGLISFDWKTWGKHQSFNPDRVLQDFTDVCLKRGIDICAITSEYWELPKGSPHNRFDFLKNQIPNLPSEYEREIIGENLMVVKKRNEGKAVYFVNGQSVIVKESLNGKNRRLGHLVIGSNQVPNLMNLRDTIQYGGDNGLIQIAEDPLLTINHRLGGSGMGESELAGYLDSYDAVIGFDAQNVFPNFLGKILPPLSSKTKSRNKIAQEVAKKYKKSYVAVANSHRMQDVGLSHIAIDTSSHLILPFLERQSIRDLKRIIYSGNFTNIEKYAPMLGVLEWGRQFREGINSPDYYDNDKLDKKYEAIFE